VVVAPLPRRRRGALFPAETDAAAPPQRRIRVEHDQKVRDLRAQLEAERRAHRADGRRRRPAAPREARHDQARAEPRGEGESRLRDAQKGQAPRARQHVPPGARRRALEHLREDALGLVALLVQPKRHEPELALGRRAPFEVELQRAVGPRANRVDHVGILERRRAADRDHSIAQFQAQSLRLAARRQGREHALPPVIAHRQAQRRTFERDDDALRASRFLALDASRQVLGRIFYRVSQG